MNSLVKLVRTLTLVVMVLGVSTAAPGTLQAAAAGTPQAETEDTPQSETARTSPGVEVLLPKTQPQEIPGPVVHAVLFYHPTCPHCHELITQYLIPLQEQHGSQLVILGMDTSQQWANNLYWEAVRHYEVPEEDWAVPMMVVGENAFVGGEQIPTNFSPILDQGLAGEGVDLPSYPALVTFLREQNALDPRYPNRLIARQSQSPQEARPPAPDSSEAEESVSESDTAVAENPPSGDSASSAIDAGAETPSPSERPAQPAAATPEPETGGDGSGGAEAPAAREPAEALDRAERNVGVVGLEEAAEELESMTMWDRFNLDRTGNSLSVLVLALMVVSLALRGYPPRVKGGEWPLWITPALILAGAGVAAYLSFVEVTQTQAVCGPVGDCNTVNQSEYATLFGVLPVGLLGLIGYGVILVSWVLRHSSSAKVSRLATLSLWGAVLFGTLFSVYLTFLEPFVIGATCAWCLTSAVVLTLLLWATSPLASRVWSKEQTPSEAR